MLNTPPKELRENIARANGYLKRNEIVRALEAMTNALKQYAGIQLMKGARAEIDIHILDFLHTLVHHQIMQPLLDPNKTGNPKNIVYQQGKENALATVLEGLAKILNDNESNKAQKEQEEKLERKKSLIANGMQMLKDGQVAKGRAFLKRVAEEFTDEAEIRIQLGKIFESGGHFQEAAEMYEDSIKVFPRESAAYTGAVNSWLQLREYEKAEIVYQGILRTFGGHPSTFGKMAKMYLEWHKREKAEEMALRALQADKDQADAKEVMAALDRR